jgi:penicillin-binding protein 2
LNEKQFLTHYDQRLFLPMPVLNNLNPQQLGVFVEKLGGLPGVDLEATPTRAYPNHSVAAHLLGYLRRENSLPDDERFYNYRMPDYQGASGIEGAFDSQLRGATGVKSVLVNSLGYRQSESLWTPAEAGHNVFLTIDLAVQRAAESALHSSIYGTNTRGAVVVMDVRNGDVLALASNPTFDPAQFVSGISSEAWTNYFMDEKLRPLINRASSGTYAPGSVFKIIVGLAGLEAGTLNPDEVFHSKGYYDGLRGRPPINDTAGAGDFNFRRALIKSSNSYFITEGFKVGVDRVLEMAKRFHFGELTGVPVSESKGILPTREWQRENLGGWFDGNTANLSIGQGETTVTPLQVAVMMSAIANGGNVYWPRVVTRIEPQALLSFEPPIVFPSGRLRDTLRVSEKNLKVIHAAMLADVEDAEGTGRRAAVSGMRICAKTGTAQKTRGRTQIGKTVWFASFAPFENPRYAVVAMVDDDTGSGGDTCAPIAHVVYLALQKREQTRPAAAESLVRNN